MLEVDHAAKRNFFLSSSGSSVFSGRIKVIELLEKGLWKAVINGVEYKIYSDIQLSKDSVIRGVIKFVNNTLVLKEILSQEPDTQKAPVFFAAADMDSLVKNLYASFFKSGLNIGSREFLTLKKLVMSRLVNDRHYIAFLTDAVLKGFKTESVMLALLDALNRDRSGSSGSSRQGKERKNSSRQSIVKEIRSIVENTGKGSSVLFLYNHISHSGSHWVIFPYALGEESNYTSGSIRIRFSISGEIEKTVIHAQKYEKIWFFALNSIKKGGSTGKEKYILKIYSNPIGASSLKGSSFEKLRKKLQNLEVIIDDNIYDLSIFDGFSTTELPESLDVSV